MTDASLGAAMDPTFGATAGEFLDYITDIGLDHIEFKREYLHGHPETPSPEQLCRLAAEYDVSITYHAPFRDWNLASVHDTARRASIEQVTQTIDDAVVAGAGAVVVHGGSVQRRYPAWIHETAREHAIDSLTECAEYAASRGMPLCLENQPPADTERRFTTTPDDLAAIVDAVDVDPDYFGVTLDVGHAGIVDASWQPFVDRFGDRIRVCHLHDNDGTADQHEPLPDHDRFLDSVPADFFVFETVSVPDVARSAGVSPPPFTPALQSTG